MPRQKKRKTKRKSKKRKKTKRAKKSKTRKSKKRINMKGNPEYFAYFNGLRYVYRKINPKDKRAKLKTYRILKTPIIPVYFQGAFKKRVRALLSSIGRKKEYHNIITMPKYRHMAKKGRYRAVISYKITFTVIERKSPRRVVYVHILIITKSTPMQMRSKLLKTIRKLRKKYPEEDYIIKTSVEMLT